MHTLEGAVQYPPNCNKMCVKKRLILPILLVSSQNRLTNWLFGMKLHTSQYKSAMSWLLWLWYYLQSAIMVHHSFPFYSMSKSFIYNNSRGKKKSGGRVAQGGPVLSRLYAVTESPSASRGADPQRLWLDVSAQSHALQAKSSPGKTFPWCSLDEIKMKVLSLPYVAEPKENQDH